MSTVLAPAGHVGSLVDPTPIHRREVTTTVKSVAVLLTPDEQNSKLNDLWNAVSGSISSAEKGQVIASWRNTLGWVDTLAQK